MARLPRGKVVRGRRASVKRTKSTGPGELVTYLARGLVDDPAAVNVTESRLEHSNVLELRVGMNDLGKVIGKSGRTAQAIRTLLDMSADRLAGPATLDIKD